MKPQGYIAVGTDVLPRVFRVLSVLPGRAVLECVHTGEMFYYSKGSFIRVQGSVLTTVTNYRGIVNIPSYLESQALSNAIIHWAQTILDERAAARSKGK